MRAMVLRSPRRAAARPLGLEDYEAPLPGPGELLLRLSACAVCRTDLQLCEGDIAPRRLPVVPGHQAVGRVEAVGEGVEGWRVGERAGIGWLAGACGACGFCTGGRENLCEQAEFTGWDRDGGFAERMVVRAAFTLRLPESFADDVAAAPLLCGGIIGYRSLKRSGIQPGGRLGLYGFGASALLALQVAKHWGCEVFVCSRSEKDRVRALEAGADWYGLYDDLPPAPLDAAVTFAPTGSVVVAALKALARGATVAINAIHLDQMPSFPYELLWLERNIVSVANYTRADAAEFMALAAEAGVRTTVRTFALEEANEALVDLAEGRVEGAAVLRVG
ncbi:MAG TPA: zinc-dependent alcohol dehydrogenase family protein [Dehalococcoidia bacterium]|nr:zinc-dependent alcohol dehydrogenase family protein [Dehalococcoidia bacterium]